MPTRIRFNKLEGIVFGEREHHQATVRLVKKSDDLSTFLQSEIGELPSIGTPPAVVSNIIHPSSICATSTVRVPITWWVLRGVGEHLPGVDGIALMRHQLPATDQFAHERDGEDVLLEALPMLIEAGFRMLDWLQWNLKDSAVYQLELWSTMLRVPERDEQLRLRSIELQSKTQALQCMMSLLLVQMMRQFLP